MPYIITTTHDCPRCGIYIPCERHADTGPAHYAVATLEEAREIAHQTAGASGTWVRVRDAVRDADALPESGSTVGPLPDGSVIEVRKVGWWELWHAVRPNPPADSPLWEQDHILAVYNAR